MAKYARITAIIPVALALALPHKADAQASHRNETTKAICTTFGRYCKQALRVAWCESRYSTFARNGQYLGLFQMGSWERRTYGHGSSPWAQSRAAYRYFAASGHDWSPWSCKP